MLNILNLSYTTTVLWNDFVFSTFALQKLRFDMAEKFFLSTSAKNSISTEYQFGLEFYIFQENSEYIAYCPSLDISTSGKDFNEAVANFYECFQLHIECCIEYGTLYDDLIAHDWKLQKKRHCAI